ncbi:LOW QUALITY PROTEIN: Gag protein, partial [Phytophthora palmivora]
MDRGEFPHLTGSRFESIQKMVGIFGGDALRILAAATPAEQAERIEAFDTYERGLVAHAQGLQAPVAEVKALISTERLRVAFALSKPGRAGKDLGGQARGDNAGLLHNLGSALRAAFLPANYEYRQRSRFLACKQGKRELHEYIQEMRVLTTSVVGNPLPEHIKVTVFIDGLKVGPSRTQLLCVHADTMEEAIQIALHEKYNHRQARTPISVRQGHNASSGALGHMQRACPAGGQRKFPVKPRGSRGLVLIDSGASTNFARRQTVARNGDKYADALCEREGRGQVSVRLADGTVVNVPGSDFDSTESFLVLVMDKYDLILGMPWLAKHEPWIDSRGGLAGPQSPTELCNVPTSVRDWGTRDGRQGAYAPEEVLGVTESNEDVATSLATGRETKAHCQACGIATTASPNAKSRRAVWASTVAVPDGTDQAGNIGPQAAKAAKESAKGVSCVGNIGPQVGNIGPQAGNIGPQAGNI